MATAQQSRVAETTTRGAQCTDGRSATAVLKCCYERGVTGLTEAVRTMGQTVSKPRPEDMMVGKPEPYARGKDFDD